MILQGFIIAVVALLIGFVLGWMLHRYLADKALEGYQIVPNHILIVKKVKMKEEDVTQERR